jgi:anti-sigma factor RsiW
MSVTQADLELLDAYLDDALEDADREAVRARLSTDQSLVAALDQLRAQRALRQSFFAALEPTETEVDQLAVRVRESLERRRRFTRILRAARYVAAAAACFAAGILVHATYFTHSKAPNPNPLQPIANTSATVRAVELYEVTLRDDSGKILAIQRFDSLDKANAFAADLASWQRRADRLASSQFIIRAQRL